MAPTKTLFDVECKFDKMIDRKIEEMERKAKTAAALPKPYQVALRDATGSVVNFYRKHKNADYSTYKFEKHLDYTVEDLKNILVNDHLDFDKDTVVDGEEDINAFIVEQNKEKERVDKLNKKRGPHNRIKFEGRGVDFNDMFDQFKSGHKHNEDFFIAKKGKEGSF